MCLVGRQRERENWWGLTISSLGPPNYNLSKIERKQERKLLCILKDYLVFGDLLIVPPFFFFLFSFFSSPLHLLPLFTLDFIYFLFFSQLLLSFLRFYLLLFFLCFFYLLAFASSLRFYLSFLFFFFFLNMVFNMDASSSFLN